MGSLKQNQVSVNIKTSQPKVSYLQLYHLTDSLLSLYGTLKSKFTPAMAHQSVF